MYDYINASLLNTEHHPQNAIAYVIYSTDVSN